MSRLFDALAHLRAAEGLLLAFEARCPAQWERATRVTLSVTSQALDQLEGLAHELQKSSVVAPGQADPEILLSVEQWSALENLDNRRLPSHESVGDLMRLGLAAYDDEGVVRLTRRGLELAERLRSGEKENGR